MSAPRRVVVQALIVALSAACAWGAVTAKVKTYETKGGKLTIASMASGVKRYDVRMNDLGVGLGPEGPNWYLNEGFLEVKIGKTAGGKRPKTLDLIRSEPSIAVAELKWVFDEGPVTARFTLKADEDKVLVTFAFPKGVQGTIDLRAYPSDFAGGWKQGEAVRRRRIVTPLLDKAVYDEEAKKQVGIKHKPTAEEPWALFMDDHFDVAKSGKKTNGPCAILVNQADCKSVVYYMGHYSTDVRLTPKLNAPVRVALWDLTGKTNAEAREIMKKVTLDTLGVTPVAAP